MNQPRATAPVLAILVVLAAPQFVAGATPDREGDRAAVERAVRASIGWATTKDRPLLESVMAHDPELFIFHPDGGTDVRGWSAFAKLFDVWMDPRFVATSVDIRDLHIHLSRDGDVAWFNAILDDCGSWEGKEGCWKDTRWSGVLERRDERWQIVQMHFSFAKERPAPTAGGE